MDLGVGNRPADRDAELGLRDLPGARPDRGFGRPVEVPHLAAAREQLLRKVPGEALAADQRLEAAAAHPARVDQVAPGGRRGLHHVGAAGFEQGAQRGAVEQRVAAGEGQLGAHAQRQQQLEDRDVETQRRDGDEMVARSQSRLTRHAGQEVDDRTVRNDHALGLTGRARGVDHVRRIVAARVVFIVRFQREVEFGGDR